MNVFIIPSWYPSPSNPVYGTFNYEQARMLANTRKNWCVGVSTWGQGDARFLLPARNPASLLKFFRRYSKAETEASDNLKEYFSPAFTWTRKIASGNIKRIILANEENLKRFINDFGTPDILSAQATYPAAIIARHLSDKYHIPYVVTIRMSPFPFNEFLTKGGRIKPFAHRPLKDASRLIATSDSLKTRLHSFHFEQVEVINNPVDLSFFKPDENIGTSHDLLVAGRTEHQKGIDILINSIKYLEDFKGKIRIAGDGSLLHLYRRLAEEAQVDDRIEWLGTLSREKILEEMRNCSFYVLSSRHETFGNVLLEAMACGKPVVATKCGGPEEIVTPESGYLCDIEQEDLADKINKMLRNRSSFDSEKIRNDVTRRFSPEVWAEKLEQLFRSVISR